MATAKKLKSGSWRVQVYSHSEFINGKERKIRKSFTSNTPGPAGKREAELMAAKFAEEKERITKPSDLTFGEAFDKYVDMRKPSLSPRTTYDYRRIRATQLQDLMDVHLRDINQEVVQQAINQDIDQGHSPKTVRNHHGLISAILGEYRPDLRLRTVLPKKVRAKIYVPSDADVQALIKHVAGTVMEIPVLLAAFGPMRRGEICALDADHIKGNTVHVEKNMVLNDAREWVTKSPKSYAGDRYIDFPDFVSDRWKGITGRITDLTPDQITRRFTKILKETELPHFRFHDLRHYCASIQHALGVPDSYIMARGGWGNDGTLKAVYRHTMQEKEKEMNALANDHFSTLVHTKNHTN